MSDHPYYEGRHGDVLGINLWYPRSDDTPTCVQLGLMDVRAADSIRISYDFDRDGWKIEQANVFEQDWQEVAFVQAWGREV